MSMTVYLKNGHAASVPNAVKAEREYAGAPGPPGTDAYIPALICTDASGQEVGFFVLGEVAGWTVDPEPPSPRAS